MEATSSVPPNTDVFDPSKRNASLLSGVCPVLQPSALQPAPVSNLGHLSQILTIMASARTLSTPSHINSTILTPSSITPATPEAKHTKDTPIPSPSDISHYVYGLCQYQSWSPTCIRI